MYKLSVVLLCGLVTSMFWLTTPRCAFACSCAAPGPPKSELSLSEAVFAGHVIDIEKPSGTLMSSVDPISVTLQVSTVWKGPAYKTMVVQTVRESASCGFPFEIGQDYLIYARGTEAKRMVSLCSRTQLLTDAAEDIRQFGQGMIPQREQPLSPVPSDTTTSDPPRVPTHTPVAATDTMPATTLPVAMLLSIVVLVGVPIIWGIGRLQRK